MKEALAAVLGSPQQLDEDPVTERPVDRLHALAASPLVLAGRESHLVALGRDLIALKHARRSEYFWAAVERLAWALSWSSHKLDLKSWDRTTVARWALTEWVEDACDTCAGRGSVPIHQEAVEGRQGMKQCPTCNGTMKRRYSDAERTKGVGEQRLAERPLFVAHGLIGDAERLAIQMARKLCERSP